MTGLDFELGRDEQDVLDAVVTLLEREGGLAVARAVELEGRGISREVHKALGDAGFLGIAVPEAQGGSGMPLAVAVQLSRAVGRYRAPVPVLESGLLVPAWSARMDPALASSIVRGQMIPTAWLPELAPHGPGPGAVTIRAGRASGRTAPLPYGADADVALVAAGEGAALVDLRDQHERVALPDMDALGLVRFELRDAAVLATSDHPSPALVDQLRLLVAAEAAGGAEACLRLAVAYALQREQFGRQIGAFQAVQHRLADAAIHTDCALLLVHRAAAIHGVAGDAAGPIQVAWRAATRAFVDVSRAALQVFGGYGFTLEYDVQLYYRHAKRLETAFGPQRGVDLPTARAMVSAVAHDSL